MGPWAVPTTCGTMSERIWARGRGEGERSPDEEEAERKTQEAMHARAVDAASKTEGSGGGGRRSRGGFRRGAQGNGSES